MNMNELKEEELDMVAGGSFWSTLKQIAKTVTNPIGTMVEIIKETI